MPKNATITSIVNTGAASVAYRILTVDLSWPSGKPPFASGAVSVPAIGTPPAYAQGTFDPAVWTDVTALVSEYRYNQDSGSSCDQLSLSVPAAWNCAVLAQVFREMRVILVQEQYFCVDPENPEEQISTGWLNRCWTLSDGYQESWQGGDHHYVVNAKDALKLANLEVLGSATGSAVYQADVVTVGTYSEHQQLTLVTEATDAWEYALALTPGSPSTTAIQPNWADAPAPQFWCHNARDFNGDPYGDPVPLAVGGAAVQAVFGEGIVRVGIGWARTAPGKGNDFSQGLGLHADEEADIRGVVSRFAHPATTDRTGRAVASDLATGLATVSVTGNVIRVDEELTGKPAGLTLLLRDGTGRRYRTITLEVGTGYTDITVAGTPPTIANGTACVYGDANLVTDFVTRLLTDCGYQMTSSGAALYLNPPSTPVIRGAATDIILPPMVYHDTDGTTALAAIDDLRRNGYVPPNWILRADANGQIFAGSISQLADGNAGIVPLAALSSIDYDRSDIGIATRVVARGIARQVDDLADVGKHPTVTIEDWTGDNALPSPAYTLTAAAVRSGASGQSYNFSLANLLTRNLPYPKNWSGKSLRPWGWFLSYEGADNHIAMEAAVALRAQWRGAVLAEITLAAESLVEGIEIHSPNAWRTDKQDWGGGFHNSSVYYVNDGVKELKAHADPQILTIEYYDAALASWYPLAANITCKVDAVGSEAVQRLQAEQFVPRQAVTTSRLRLVCNEPFFAEHRGTRSKIDYNATIGVWLTQVKIWSGAEIRGVAELGNAGNYNSELVADPWPAIAERMRSRSYILPEAVPWVGTQDDADWLAIEWLKEKTRDLAPRKVSVVRPDVRLWDTVSFDTPAGAEITGLVITCDHNQQGITSLTVVDYERPYFEELT